MRGFQTLFSEGSEDYAKFRPTYPDDLYQKILDHVQGRDLVVDVATGTGQAAMRLSKSFKHVVAIDSSPEQLAQATPADNVEFKVANAEDFVDRTGLEPRTADVVTVAAALHCFDADAFYAQCQKILRPDGILAAWAYADWNYDANPEATAALRELRCDVLGPYWLPPIRHIAARYAELLPSAERFRESSLFDISVPLRLNMRRCVGYLATWSAYRAFKAKNPGVKDPIKTFCEKTIAALGLQDEETEFEVVMPLFGVLAKGPQAP